MITTRKLADGKYLVYENNKPIGTIIRDGTNLDTEGFTATYYMEISKYNIRRGVKMNLKNFKKPDKPAVNALIMYLKVKLVVLSKR